MCVCVLHEGYYHAHDLYWHISTSRCVEVEHTVTTVLLWMTDNIWEGCCNHWEQGSPSVLCPPCPDHKHIPAIDFPLTPSRLEASANPDTHGAHPTSTYLLLDSVCSSWCFYSSFHILHLHSSCHLAFVRSIPRSRIFIVSMCVVKSSCLRPT